MKGSFSRFVGSMDPSKRPSFGSMDAATAAKSYKAKNLGQKLSAGRKGSARKLSRKQSRQDVGDEGHMQQRVCFSQKSELGLPFVKLVVGVLCEWGMPRGAFFFQEDIDEGGRDCWRLQWLHAAMGADIVLCVVTKDYCTSQPCCTEYAAACKGKKELKVQLENMDGNWIDKTIKAAKGHKGEVLTDLWIGAQMIQAWKMEQKDAVLDVATRIYKKVNGYAPPAVTTVPTPKLGGKQLSAIGQCPLLEKKLANPQYPLNEEESIEVLAFCMKMGNKAANQAKHKHAVIVIGNTGGGKSTFCNFVAGCKMKMTAIDGGLHQVAMVVGKSEGGPLDEIMKIGHNSKQSETFTPGIWSDSNDNTFIDCPGFLDTRTFEINIANAVNIRLCLTSTASARVVVLINFHTLSADRGRGLTDLLKILTDLFGSEDDLKLHIESILVGVSNYPLENSLGVLQRFFVKDTPDDSLMRIIAQRLFIFHPTDKGDEEDGFWTRQRCVNRINTLPRITSPGRLFKTVLNDTDTLELQRMAAAMGTSIQESLAGHRFCKAAKCYRSLERLQAIEHATIERLLRQSQGQIHRYFKAQIRQFSMKLKSGALDEAEDLLELLKTGSAEFGAVECVDEHALEHQLTTARGNKMQRAQMAAEFKKQLEEMETRHKHDKEEDAAKYKKQLEDMEKQHKQDKEEWAKKHKEDLLKQTENMRAEQSRMNKDIVSIQQEMQMRKEEGEKKKKKQWSYLPGASKRKQKLEAEIQQEQEMLDQHLRKAEAEKSRFMDEQREVMKKMVEAHKQQLDEVKAKLAKIEIMKQQQTEMQKKLDENSAETAPAKPKAEAQAAKVKVGVSVKARAAMFDGSGTSAGGSSPMGKQQCKKSMKAALQRHVSVEQKQQRKKSMKAALQRHASVEQKQQRKKSMKAALVTALQRHVSVEHEQKHDKDLEASASCVRQGNCFDDAVNEIMEAFVALDKDGTSAINTDAARSVLVAKLPHTSLKRVFYLPIAEELDILLGSFDTDGSINYVHLVTMISQMASAWERDRERQERLENAGNAEYHFTNYARIRPTDTVSLKYSLIAKGGMLEWQSTVIQKSLLELDTDLSKMASRIHKNILGYMGDKAMPQKATLAQDILQKGLEVPELVDEIYMQIMKQLSNNPKQESIARGWQLMCMCAGTFPPSRDFEKYLLNYILEKKDSTGAVGNYGRYSLHRLEGMRSSGASGFVLSVEEIQAYTERPPFLATIELVNEVVLTEELPVTPDLNVAKVLEICTTFLDLQDPRSSDFGIFVVDIDDDELEDATPKPSEAMDLPRTPCPLQNGDYMGDVMVEKARQGRACKFVFKRKLFVRDCDEESEDWWFNYLVYLQAAEDVITGNIPLTDEATVIDLAAKAAAVGLADEFPNNPDDLLEAGVVEYVPVPWREKYSDGHWANVILAKRNTVINDDGLRTKYVDAVKGHELYGTLFFHVKKVNEVEPNGSDTNATSTTSDISELSVRQLKQMARDNGVDISKCVEKPEIVSLIQKALRSGNNTVASLPANMIAAFNSDGLHFLDENRKILMSFGYADIYSWSGSSVQFSLIIWNAETKDTFEMILTTFQAAGMAALMTELKPLAETGT